MSKPTDEYIWVSVDSGVMGFEPEEIIAFENELNALNKMTSGIDYWDYFNYVHAAALQGQRAYCFSAVWHFEKAWAMLEYLRSVHRI